MGQRVARFILCGMACIAISTMACVVSAQSVNPFTFDFTPSVNGERFTGTHIFCSVPGEINHNCSGTNPSAEVIENAEQGIMGPYQTQWLWGGNMADDFESRFLQEIVTIDGVDYYHLTIGDPASGFSQEVYIGRSPLINTRVQSGNIFSDSGGVFCYPAGINIPFELLEGCDTSNASYAPLRHDSDFTGNGTGNPSKMVMRQVIDSPSDGFSQEFLKNILANKPIITQTSSDATIDALFVMDMSNSDYLTDDTPGTMINTFNITAPTLMGNMGDFVFTPTEGTNITGGRYTFQRTSKTVTYDNGWTRTVPSSEYTYYDGSIDPVLDVDWAAFRDPNLNP